MATFRCALVDQGANVLMVKGEWRHTIIATDLPRWVNLYRGLRDREGGRYSHIYAPPTEGALCQASDGECTG